MARSPLPIFVCACLLTLVLPACADQPIQSGVPREITGLRINPYELHEDCMRMAPGDRLDYRFEAQRPVKFNIHYHEGKSVIQPITRDDVTTDDDTFRPLLAQDYCLMWEAGREGAILDYRILLVRSRR